MALRVVSHSGPTTAASGNLTLTEPTGAQQDDLLVAEISFRGSAAFTLPDGWTIVGTQQTSGNTSTTVSTSIASGLMAYIVRGSSAPSYAFTRTGGDVALGRVTCLRGVDVSDPFEAGSANTLGSNSATVTTAGFTPANPNAMLIMACCAADNVAASAQQATDPGSTVWTELADSTTTTGADTGLAVAYALQGEAGATGTFQFTSAASSRHVCIVGAFNSDPDEPRVQLSQNANNAAGTTLLTPARQHRAGNLLVVGVKGEGATTTVTITDTAGNTWVPLTQNGFSGDGARVQLFYAKNITGHDANVITATWTASRDFRRLFCIEYQGFDTTDPFIEEQNDEGIGTALSTPDITTENVGDLIVAWAGEFANVTYTPGSGYTEVWDFNEQSAGTFGGSAVEDQIVGSSGDKTVTMTQSSSADWGMVSASFRIASAGISFNGALASQAATIAATLSAIVDLSGALSAQSSTVASTLSVRVDLNGALAASASTIAGTLSAIVELSGSLAAAASFISGTFDVDDGAISFTGALAAQSSEISGTLSVIVALNGSLAAAVAGLSGTLSIIGGFTGALAAQSSTIAGTVTARVDLNGSLLSAAATLSGSLSASIALSGALASAASSISGSVSTSLTTDFAGALHAGKASLQGDLSVILSLEGELRTFDAHIGMEWRVTFPPQGVGWRKFDRGKSTRMSLPRRRN